MNAPVPATVLRKCLTNSICRPAEKAFTSGIRLDGNSGTASSFGGSFEWNYDPATKAFTITINKPPMMMNCESANARISAMVQSVLA